MLHISIGSVIKNSKKNSVRTVSNTPYRDSPAKINVGFECSFFQEENNGTIYLGVKHMLRELLQPKVGTMYLAFLRDLAVHKDHLSHHRMTSQSTKQLGNYDVM